jgi:UDP-N-acetylglucosamine 2-epimerase (non-hydrolysing)
MNKIKIINVVGARPNYMKIAPLIEEMKKYPRIQSILVHTGQHYDKNMSDLFFDDLELPKPDIFLGVGSASHAEQTAKIMIEFEKVLIKEKPNLTVVVGDVNSTVACALVSVKLGIPVAHVEAGLRSFDRTMPEEINRVLTDAISDYLFITEKDAEINLLKEGRPKNKIFFVGNVMIDTLLKNRQKARKSKILNQLSLEPGNYALLTLHRPSNVDNKLIFKHILFALEEIQRRIKIVYPVHPRTKKMINDFGLQRRFSFLNENSSRKCFFITTEPLGYLDFLKLMSEAKLVLTDSGGIQEETTVLGVPCITIRENTERPITVKQGTNVVAGVAKESIVKLALNSLNAKQYKKRIPEKWDGLAAQRIVNILLNKSLTE